MGANIFLQVTEKDTKVIVVEGEKRIDITHLFPDDVEISMGRNCLLVKCVVCMNTEEIQT